VVLQGSGQPPGMRVLCKSDLNRTTLGGKGVRSAHWATTIGFVATTRRGSEPVRLENETLYALIDAMAAPTLERVLAGVVRLLTQATDCHACFIYLRAGDVLRLRAASPVYAHVVGQIEIPVDEGVTGWVARNARPTFIRENALDDPRMKYFPELEEQDFQSMCAVPVPAPSGEVIGVLVLHTAAPREFSEDVMTFLEQTASLLAGPLENARLYEQTRKRVARLEGLSRLGGELAEASGREQLAETVTKGMRRLLGASSCRLYLRQLPSGRLELAAADPPGPDDGTAALFLDGRNGAAPPGVISAPLFSGGERVGLLGVLGAPDGREEHELVRTVAHQLALALDKAALIEQLTAENVVRDLFEAIEGGRDDLVEARARAASWKPAREAVVLVASQVSAAGDGSGWPDRSARFESGLRRLAPGSLVEIGDRSLRALVPLPFGAEDQSWSRLRDTVHELGREEELAIGLSDPRTGLTGGRLALREADDAARIARALRPQGGALSYAQLGAYKYLVRVPAGDAPRDRHFDAVQALVDYDRRRRSSLVSTLAEYLANRCSVSTSARSLYIHPNTLRQRLARIEKVSGLDLSSEDLLSLELAINLARLEA
jgi:GAF domain-containing protein